MSIYLQYIRAADKHPSTSPILSAHHCISLISQQDQVWTTAGFISLMFSAVVNQSHCSVCVTDHISIINNKQLYFLHLTCLF